MVPSIALPGTVQVCGAQGCQATLASLYSLPNLSLLAEAWRGH